MRTARKEAKLSRERAIDSQVLAARSKAKVMEIHCKDFMTLAMST